VNAEHDLLLAPAPLPLDPVVRSGRDRRDVARDRKRLGELHALRIAVGVGRRDLLVGEHEPAGGRGHDERVPRLHVGLLEARHDTAGVGGLVVRVQVGLVVDGIDEAVQPLP